MKRLIFVLLPLLLFYSSCYAQHDFKYIGDLPTEKYVVHSFENGDYTQLSGDSIDMRNRVYIQLDSSGQVRINGHKHPLKEFEDGIRYILSNPDHKAHLPESFNSAMIFANYIGTSVDNYQADQLFRIQFISQTLNHVAFSEMENYISNVLQKDWVDINETDVALIEEKYTLQFALPVLEDKRIRVKLPDWSEEEPDIKKYKARNVMTILVNAQDQIMVRMEPAQIKDITLLVKEFISNPNQREDLAEAPIKAIISLKNDRGTSYKVYLEVYNAIKAAYNELWETEAQKRYSKSYKSLNYGEQKSIKADIPLVISEAEPTDFGKD